MDKGAKKEMMRKKHLVVLLVMIALTTVFQLFLRYETIEVGPYQIKDDRLTLKVYAKHGDSSKWGETRFKTLSGARAYLERKMSLEGKLEGYFLWSDDM
jgi:hypothetical protein